MAPYECCESSSSSSSHTVLVNRCGALPGKGDHNLVLEVSNIMPRRPKPVNRRYISGRMLNTPAYRMSDSPLKKNLHVILHLVRLLTWLWLYIDNFCSELNVLSCFRTVSTTHGLQHCLSDLHGRTNYVWSKPREVKTQRMSLDINITKWMPSKNGRKTGQRNQIPPKCQDKKWLWNKSKFIICLHLLHCQMINNLVRMQT